MNDDKIEAVKVEQNPKKDKSVVCIGLDVGTMHLVCARSDSPDVKVTRNVFLPVDKDEINMNHLSSINYVKGSEGEVFIVGSDAFEFANLFGQEVSRPMEKGLISSKEWEAIDVLTLMIKDLIGPIDDKDAYCSYSIPAEPIDEDRTITYHENAFARILNKIGVNYTSVNEAMAIIYSECAKENFSGIGISFGAGMANCISGETEIPLLDGSVKTIKDLAENYKHEKFWVYSCKEDGSIVPGLAHSARKIGTKSVIRIHLDNDSYFDCTEDHPIMMRDGRYIEAASLKENDSLMPLYLEESKWNEMPGYLSCYNNKDKYWEMVHNMVMREHYGIFRSKNYITHHGNLKKKDNRPENLLSCKKEDHFKFHSEIASMGGKAASKIIIKQRKEELSERCKNQKPWLHRKEMINSGTWKEENIPWNKGLKGDEYKKYFKNEFSNQYTNPNNHKVVKIEKLNVYREVYDLTVDKYHNFAINNGIFIHNCAIAYKGIEAHKFSTARAGDWIDNQVAKSVNMIPNRVTNLKERYMKLRGNVEIKNKKTKRVLEALYDYHKSLIEYTIKKIIKEFEDRVDMEVDEEIPVIISGGTSLPDGFVNLFKSIITNYELPFEISEVRRARNPLTAVANGLLIRTVADVKGK
jgi:hypothetical protein